MRAPATIVPPTWPAVIIGGSAGALPLLPGLLAALPVDLPAAVAVVLHVRASSDGSFARHLGERCPLPTRLAESGARFAPGVVHVAPPGYHLLVDEGPTLALSVDPPVAYVRPSIDVAFESAADVFRAALVAVVLSGANEDGRVGALRVARLGGRVLVQAPATAAAPTMPEAVLAAVPEARSIDPTELSAMIRQALARGARRGEQTG